MAIDIQDGGVTAALVKRFGLRGRFRPRLDEVLVPVAVVADLRETDQDLEPTQYWENAAVAGVAGEVSAIRFTGAPGWLMKPLWVAPAPSADDRILVNSEVPVVTSVLTGPTTTRGQNIRDVAGPGAPVSVTAGTIAVVPGNRVAEYDVLAAETSVIDLRGWTLRAGEFLWVHRATLAGTCVFTFAFTAERAT